MATAIVNAPKYTYDITGYREIPLDQVEPNPNNPRPSFHMAPNNPQMQSLADDIAVNGQHLPGIVFQVAPGKYRLIAGERRLRACRIAQVGFFRANLIEPPLDATHEQIWLGLEESHKQDWQAFFRLRHAAAMAKSQGLDRIDHPDIAIATGLRMAQLKIADKIFRLEPAIQQRVADYEEQMYLQRVEGVRAKTGRMHGPRSAEYNQFKAALTWDIYWALRQDFTGLVRDYPDLELQTQIANTVAGTSREDSEKLLSTLRQAGKNPPPGLINQLHNMLATDTPATLAKRIVRTGGNAQAARLAGLEKACERVHRQARSLKDQVDHVGSDPQTLRRIAMQIQQTSLTLEDLSRRLDRRVRTIGEGEYQ